MKDERTEQDSSSRRGEADGGEMEMQATCRRERDSLESDLLGWRDD